MSSYSGTGAGSYGALGGTIKFEWEPSPDMIADSILQLADYLENVEAPLLLSKQVAIEDIRARFESKTTPDGAAWVEWSESYAPKAIATNVNGLLVRTGNLEEAATSENAFLVTTESIFYDMSGLPPYGIWNDQGATRGEGFSSEDIERAARAGFTLDATAGANVLPARQFTGLSFEGELRVIEIFDQWFEGAISLAISSKGKIFGRHSLKDSKGRFTART